MTLRMCAYHEMLDGEPDLSCEHCRDPDDDGTVEQGQAVKYDGGDP